MAAVIGAADAGLRTTAGRAIVVRAALGFANAAIDGTLTVGGVEGSLLGGLEAHDVRIEGTDGVEMARIAEVAIRYRLRDLLAGRIVLGQLRLTRPTVYLVQLPSGRLNIEDVFRLGRPAGPGRPPLIAFSGVEVTGGTLTLRTPADTARTVRGLEALLPYVRLSSPILAERDIRIEVADLKADISNPALDIRGAEGLVRIEGDSARLDMEQVTLPGTRAKVDGWISWHGRTPHVRLAVETTSMSVDDVRGFAPKIPVGLEAAGAFNVRTETDGTFELASDRILVTGRNGGGHFTGRLAFVLGPAGAWAANGTDILLDSFDLEYVRPVFDTLPIAGRLTGTLKADGPREHVVMTADWVFRDSLVHRAESRLRAHGTVSVGAPRGFVFHGVALEESRIDLATVRRLLPAVKLRGILAANGTLNGPWLESEFSGTLRYRDAPLPQSVARGLVRVDARHDTLGVWANLAWDSLAFQGFRQSYPGFGLTGVFAGETRVSGYADSLAVTADLVGPAGRVVASGAVTLVGAHSAVRGLDIELREGSLDGLDPRLPPSRMFGRVTGMVELDSLVAPVVRLKLAFDSSIVAGSVLDSARGTVGAADSVVRFDSLSLWGRSSRLVARGGLGFGSRPDSLLFTAEFDALSPIEPFARWALALPPEAGSGGLGGQVRARGAVSGTVSQFRIAGDVTIPRARWGLLALTHASVGGEWRNTAQTAVRLDFTADSASMAGMSFARASLSLTGRRDSLGWRVSTELQDSAVIAGAGRAHGDSLAIALPIDSLVFALPVHRWRADTGAVAVWTRSTLEFRHTSLTSTGGGAKVALEGSLPLREGGIGQLHGSLQQLPLKDLLAVLQREYHNVAGALSGTFDLTGVAAAPEMRGAFTLVNGVYMDFRAPQAEATLTYSERRLQGTGSLRRLGEHVLDLEVDLPLDLALELRERRQVDGPLRIHAVADSVDLSIAEALTPQVRQASGRLDADAQITGTWNRPALAGVVRIVNGAASYPSVGVRHEGITGKFSLVGDTIRIDTLTMQSTALASRREHGKAEVSGFVRLEQLGHPQLGLHFHTDDFHVLDVRNFLSAVATGDLELTGPVFGANLTGSGTMTHGVLYFADLITKQVVNLEDTLFRDVVQDTALIRRQGLGPAFENRFWDSLTISNLSLELGSDAWLRSNEANIQLEGSVQVVKDHGGYRLNGSLATPRGTYRLTLLPTVTREFTVVGGQVQYFGTPDLNAALNVSAQHVVKRRAEANVTVSVNVAGTLYVPRLVLSTDLVASLSDAEIISLLLFGTTRAEDVAAAGASSQNVDRAVSQLSGVLFTGANNVVSNLGIPLQIRSSDVAGLTGTELALGKQFTILGTPVFLTGSHRVCKTASGKVWSFDNTGASLEFRMSRDWRVAASLEPVGSCGPTTILNNTGRQAGVDLFWERKF